METINDWKPEVLSLLQALQAGGFTIAATDNGEAKVKIKTVARALDELTACDDAYLFVTHPSEPERRLWIHLVLGNSPGDLCSDYVAADKEADKALATVISAESAKWEDKPQPKTERK